MSSFIVEYETGLRLGAFAGMLAAMGLWEWLGARRPLVLSKVRRWTTNLSMSLLNSLVLRFGLPLLAVGAAGLAEERGWGLFNQVALPGAAEFAMSLLLLDVVIYGQHVMFHKVPILWRLHRVHHADRDIDVTTGIRFHPIEILISMLIKIAVVVALGVSPVAVIVFEVVLNGTAMFNHGNVRLWQPLDAVLRRVLVTPDMHRVHHSVVRSEHNSNFGFNLSWWDRLFGTYTAQPAAGHQAMTIGLDAYRGDEPGRFGWSLWLPFAKDRLNEVRA